MAGIVRFANPQFLSDPKTLEAIQTNCPSIRFALRESRNVFAFGNIVQDEKVDSVKTDLVKLCNWLKKKSILYNDLRIRDIDFFIGAMQENT